MKGLIPLFILLIFFTPAIQSQSFTVQDLVTLSDLPSSNINRFMSRNGYVLSASKEDSVTTGASFIEKIKDKSNLIHPKRSVDIFLKDDSKYFTFHTSELGEYMAGQQSLVKAGFRYDSEKDPAKEPAMLYQKANITIKATRENVNGVTQYAFNLRERAIPSSIVYAEDLLHFDSHEFLVSFFGEQNVSRDMYYLSEKELKKCTVLFGGTPRQVVFVWGDEDHLSNLSYIIITNTLPTKNARQNKPVPGDNEWTFKNGLHAGMGIKGLLKINQADFDIYGQKSELAFMVNPSEDGKIDFRKTAVMFNCDECLNRKIFDRPLVSALEVSKANVPLVVNDIVLYP